MEKHLNVPANTEELAEQYGTVVFLGLIRSQINCRNVLRFIIAKLIDRKQVLRYTIYNGGGHDDLQAVICG